MEFDVGRMSDEFDSIPVTPMPTATQNPSVSEHQYANTVYEAHPIREVDEVTLQYPLAAIQAVATTDTLEDSTIVLETEELVYLQTDSSTFYRLASRVSEEYETKIEIEQLQKVVDLHTSQFLRDVHGFTSIEELRQLTLCNALNHPSPQSGDITFETINDSDAFYTYVDSRGLIIQKNTHSSS